MLRKAAAAAAGQRGKARVGGGEEGRCPSNPARALRIKALYWHQALVSDKAACKNNLTKDPRCVINREGGGWGREGRPEPAS